MFIQRKKFFVFCEAQIQELRWSRQTRKFVGEARRQCFFVFFPWSKHKSCACSFNKSEKYFARTWVGGGRRENWKGGQTHNFRDCGKQDFWLCLLRFRVLILPPSSNSGLGWGGKTPKSVGRHNSISVSSLKFLKYLSAFSEPKSAAEVPCVQKVLTDHDTNKRESCSPWTPIPKSPKDISKSCHINNCQQQRFLLREKSFGAQRRNV